MRKSPRKSSRRTLAVGCSPRQHDGKFANRPGGLVMAKVKAKAPSRNKKTASRSAARRASAAKPRAEVAAKMRRPHKFVKSHLRAEDFKADGLRTYAHYRDLGIKDATHGMALA